MKQAVPLLVTLASIAAGAAVILSVMTDIGANVFLAIIDALTPPATP
jgi:hypothetical protein